MLTRPDTMDVVSRASALEAALFDLARENDRAGEFPHGSVALLRDHGLLTAPFGRDLDGEGLAMPPQAGTLFEVLRRIGSGDLSVGRLYEGHVNAVMLVERYGTPRQAQALAYAVAAGAMSGVWNAEGRDPVTLERRGDGWVLRGRKILASGAGSVTRPLVTALHEGELWMVLPRLDDGSRVDLAGWTPQGMRASATGTVDLDGIELAAEDLVGAPGDYKRQPTFSGGAWRFCAVQLGAVERLLALFRDALDARGRGGDPYQLQRVAECAAATETATVCIRKAAGMVAAGALPAEEIVAYVGLVRGITERAGLDVIERTHRGIGLGSYMVPDPIERVGRDLATYLRQPAPDGAMQDAARAVLSRGGAFRDLWSAP